jgi:glycerol dehydrogenase-like iron-containing ADH family enzyme
VLVIADNAAVARRAVAWANAFTALGRLHRVRLISRAAGDVDGLVAEAVDVNATAILAAGGEAARQAAQAVAARLGLPLAIDGAADSAFPDK